MFIHNCKRHIFTVPGLLDETQVNRIINLVKQHGKILRNQTHLFPVHSELYPRYPIGRLIPDGIKIQEIGFRLSLAPSSLGKITPRMIEAAREKLRWAAVAFSFYITEEGGSEPATHVQLSTEGTSATVEVSTYRRQGRPLDRLDWVRSAIEIGKLPLKLSRGPEGANPSLKHLGSGEATLDLGEEYINFTCQQGDLSSDELLAIISRFVNRPRSSVRNLSFGFHSRENEKLDMPTEEIMSGVNELKLPFKQMEVSFWWVLKDYSYFADADKMSESEGSGFATSLFEFQFGKRRKGQLDLGTSHGFKVVFSFDRPDAHVEFAKLTKIKLKFGGTLAEPRELS